MRRSALVVVLVTVLGVLGLAGPASATPVCVGRQGTAGVCVDNRSIYLGCYYLGDDQCTDVYATVPGVVACWLGDPSIIDCA